MNLIPQTQRTKIDLLYIVNSFTSEAQCSIQDECRSYKPIDLVMVILTAVLFIGSLIYQIRFQGKKVNKTLLPEQSIGIEEEITQV